MAIRGKVLVVDDDALVLKMTQQRLERAGFSVTTRAQAIGTMQAISTEQPDVVVLDIRMPALTGPMLADLINRSTRINNVAIIFHSSESLSTLQVAAQQSGAIGAIPKTSDDSLFMAQFERLFDRAKRRTTLQ